MEHKKLTPIEVLEYKIALKFQYIDILQDEYWKIMSEIRNLQTQLAKLRPKRTK